MNYLYFVVVNGSVNWCRPHKSEKEAQEAIDRVERALGVDIGADIMADILGNYYVCSVSGKRLLHYGLDSEGEAIRTIYEKNEGVKYDSISETYVIDGINYEIVWAF